MKQTMPTNSLRDAGTSAETDIDIQIAYDDSANVVPSAEQLSAWAQHALREQTTARQHITLRIVDEPESQALNNEYRGKDKPTNVLSFPFEMPEGVPAEALPPMLGDLVVCAPVVQLEAQQQDKRDDAHWAHMIIHGVLHLLGYDHIDDAEAETMEALEIKLLAQLGFSNPYRYIEPTDAEQPTLEQPQLEQKDIGQTPTQEPSCKTK